MEKNLNPTEEFPYQFASTGLLSRTYVRQLILALICGLLGWSAALASDPLLSQTLFVVSILCGSFYATLRAFESLRSGSVDVDLLMLIVALGAFFIDAREEAVILLFLFSASGGLESFARYRTERAISSLFRVYPENVLKRIDGEWVQIPINEIAISDELLVKPGDLIPADGRLLTGQTTTDESALTGEALPVEKGPGSLLFGGTLNQHGSAVLQVLRTPSESSGQKIIRLVESARASKSPSQNLSEAIGRYYTIAVLGLSFVAFLFLQGRYPIHEAFYRTMILLVVASPCALVLSIPSAILAAIASGARSGILFRGGAAIERLVSVTHFLVDKTGTLTTGVFQITQLIPTVGSEKLLLTQAAALEEHSTHPLAHAVVAAARSRELPVPEAEQIKNIPGGGIEGIINGKRVVLGSRSLLQSLGLPAPAAHQNENSAEICLWSPDSQGTLLLSDTIRNGAVGAVRELKNLGGTVVLISGDRFGPVESVAKQLAIEDFQAAATPEQKLDRIRILQGEGHTVAMTGDGINDAPALAQSNVAIAMGDRASDTAIEESDVVIMGGDFTLLPAAVQLSHRARRVIIQNLTISIGVVITLVTAALFGAIPLSVGVLGHEGSTVIVVLNSLRLLKGIRGERTTSDE